ncbi:hypothetical protein VB712_04755 [Spirulina sp. CCNP1310]|uniref:hypothetical protein n=1 Tax=Spirulina sp. CCNP1310 TaxID=3110249 RepID=UPI002B20CBC5|nr:hypothetical protein [Spirulina sp. CCNP1310]MEA5418526.1 hypothetical protein [Spirulina sp. CCNP1310]
MIRFRLDKYALPSSLLLFGMTLTTLWGAAVQPANALVMVSGPPEILPPCHRGAVVFQNQATLHQPLACAGANIGNDLALHQPLLNWLNRGLFDDFTGSDRVWELVGQSNQAGAAIRATAHQAQGHWAIASPLQDWFVLSVATFLSYSVYLFDAGPTPITIDQGLFNTLGVSTNFRGVGHNVQRISLFTPLRVETPIPDPIFNPDPGPVAVPEPGTILSSILVLGGLRWFRRRLMMRHPG